MDWLLLHCGGRSQCASDETVVSARALSDPKCGLVPSLPASLKTAASSWRRSAKGPASSSLDSSTVAMPASLPNVPPPRMLSPPRSPPLGRLQQEVHAAAASVPPSSRIWQ